MMEMQSKGPSLLKEMIINSFEYNFSDCLQTPENLKTLPKPQSQVINSFLKQRVTIASKMRRSFLRIQGVSSPGFKDDFWSLSFLSIFFFVVITAILKSYSGDEVQDAKRRMLQFSDGEYSDGFSDEPVIFGVDALPRGAFTREAVRSWGVYIIVMSTL